MKKYFGEQKSPQINESFFNKCRWPDSTEKPKGCEISTFTSSSCPKRGIKKDPIRDRIFFGADGQTRTGTRVELGGF